MTTPLSKTLDLNEDFGPPDQGLWMQLTEKVLAGAPFEKKLVTRTPEGIATQPLYSLDALDACPWADTTPGQFPYVRGTRAAGYQGRVWDMVQELPYPTAGEFNAAARQDLSRGLNALLITLDEAGRNGADPESAAGINGTSLSTKADFDAALSGIPLADLPVHVEAGASAPAAAAMLLERPQPPVNGSVCLDPVACLATTGELPMTQDKAWDLLTAHVTSLAERAPGFRSLGVDVRWSHNAGGHAVLDLACMLASAAESLRALADRGVDPSLAASKARIHLAIGPDFFMEIAKFRAARGLWAQLVRACGGTDEAAKACIFASTSTWTSTQTDPYVNLLRATSQAFSAVVGGVDGLRVDPFDRVAGLPSDFSRRIARNIQLVLRDEAHLTEVTDPAGGSWTVETLTSELAAKAWKLFQEIEKCGGLLAALQDGSLQERLADSAATRRTLLAQRREVMVGTNLYANLEETPLEVRLPDTVALAESRKRDLESGFAVRDEQAVQSALRELNDGVPMESLVSAVRLGATLGEIHRELGMGETTRVVPVPLGRYTEDYETLRTRIAAYVAANGATPVAFLAQMGPVRQHKIRADFTAEFLKPSGFTVVADQAFDTAEAAAAAAVARGAALTVICSTDDTYPELVPAFARAVKAAAPGTLVWMAGLLPDLTDTFKEAGVDGFLHLRANNLDMLNDLHAQTGVA